MTTEPINLADPRCQVSGAERSELSELSSWHGIELLSQKWRQNTATTLIRIACREHGIRRGLLKKTTLTGESLQMYSEKCGAGLSHARLRNYRSISVYFSKLHNGTKSKLPHVLDNMAVCAPKLHAIAGEVTGCTLKAVVLVSKQSGTQYQNPLGLERAFLHREWC